ncbi:hypothetical protein MLD38_023840 [Melastoma candidum]|uniref:Uncharacterized protein n=1 Tax=Melastoma candidum TaxID=119954 RepID=A0ACB9NTT6_9MYRT|nr:hypothetical protein MLD38_023840 [Melastoma candidum]
MELGMLDNEGAEGRPSSLARDVILELRIQGGMAIPLSAMNLTWFAKLAITTAFLGRLGELQLAGGTLGFTFANVTGFSVLNGLCSAMEPICGQAYGAKNYRLLRKTLFMAIALLIVASLPISLLWLSTEKVMVHFGQQPEISVVARNYLFYLLPSLVITSFLCPLKAYLSSQGNTLPILLCSAVACACHVPINIMLTRGRGLVGVSMAIWVSDLIATVLLGMYVAISEWRKGDWSWWNKDEGCGDQWLGNWVRMLKLSGPCCLTTCLEWWCWEILILISGRLPNPKQSLGVLAIVLNFDYLLYSVMLSLATCASVRVSNELGANRPDLSRRAANVSLTVGLFSGLAGGAVMVASRGAWGRLYSHEQGTITAVKRAMLLMAALEVVNFPVAVCGGIVRGTARPWLAMYGNLGGFYLVAMPLGVLLAFEAGMGLGGLLMGFLVGVSACLVLLLVFIWRINWAGEAEKARSHTNCEAGDDSKSDQAGSAIS